MKAEWVLQVWLVAAAAAGPTVERVEDAERARFERRLPTAVSGRISPESDDAVTGVVRRQWPGTYFETAFEGSAAAFEVGPGEVRLQISVDGGPPVSLVKPQPGLYRVSGLSSAPHRLRIDVASESQAGATAFGGFRAAGGTAPLPLTPRPRQVEFIGDSHTVGYGNTSASRTCSAEEIWRTTDASQGIAPRTAQRFGADYQVNAISGRGIVRNYNGAPGDTLPQAYPFTLFDRAERYGGSGWAPQVIVIALGTNDFSTPLRSGEPWRTREALRADFAARYVQFVEMLRGRHPDAYFVLWATDLAEGEIAREAAGVVERLRGSGEQRIGFVPVAGLEMSGCDWHPSLADDEAIARAIAAHLDARPEVWRGR